MSQITLTASMRSNLLSLQQISKLQDKTQLRLASGLKVNSAIDNPSSYYTAQSLSSRANDLSALLDAMGQGVQTIKAATEGIEKAEDLLKQMKAVAEQTESPRVPEKEYFEKQVGANGAVVTTAEELRNAVNSGKETICVYGNIDLGDISTSGGLQLKENQKLVGVGYYGDYSNSEGFSSLSATASVANKNLIDITKSGCLISDLSLKYENYTSGEAHVIRTKLKNVTGYVNNLKINAVFSHESSIYMRTAISSAQGATIKIGGKIDIEVSGLNANGIVPANSQSCCEILPDAQVNIQATGSNANGIWVYLGGSCNIASGSTINIKSDSSIGIYIEGNSTLEILKGANVNIISGLGIHLYKEAICNISGNLEIMAKQGITTSLGFKGAVNILSDANVYFNFEREGFCIAKSSVLNIESGAKLAFEKDSKTKWYEVQENYQNENTSGTNNLISYDNIETKLNVINTDAWQRPSTIIALKNAENENNKNYTLVITDKLISLIKNFNSTLTQYDSLISDSWYKGTNLLQGGFAQN